MTQETRLVKYGVLRRSSNKLVKQLSQQDPNVFDTEKEAREHLTTLIEREGRDDDFSVVAMIEVDRCDAETVTGVTA
ncbi:hypothetical protein [Salinibaculum rarum]|uniref:hypothetical protein n=1 Tax=Salinibaculum rarum TaxID=3058903 RepID=UPI00265E400B|nr:hypothetical protein [Salinibaculum sp. KK48]